ncbi:hypothetical protein Tco_1098781 [Tanacetum coccineum]
MDGKKIIITEASIRSDLQLNDEEGTDCLPNATIFEEVSRMGYEKLSQKLTFYKKQRSRRPKRKDTEIPQSSVPSDNVADEAVNEEMDDSLVRAATTASSLEAEQDSVPSDESSLGDQEDASKQGRKIDDIDKDAEITLVDETQGRYGDDIIFDVSDLAGEEVFIVEQGVPNTMKRVNTFVDYRTELVEGSSKKANVEIAQDSSSKRARDELEQEKGKKSYYQIIRDDGSSKLYLVFSHMLKSFDKEDLETLYKLVKAKYGSTRPVEDLDLVLYGELKKMFDPHVKDQVRKNQSDYRVLEWKLYNSCGVHSLRK